jgi:hypothetical protein
MRVDNRRQGSVTLASNRRAEGASWRTRLRIFLIGFFQNKRTCRCSCGMTKLSGAVQVGRDVSKDFDGLAQGCTPITGSAFIYLSCKWVESLGQAGN